MKKTIENRSTLDSIDYSDYVSISESLVSTVKQSESNSTRMERTQTFNDNTNYIANRHGYIRFGERPNMCSLIKGLQYPKGIDPYKVCREIIFLILICILLVALFGISFINILIFKNFGKESNENVIEESMMCGLVMISGLFLTIYGFHTGSYVQSLLNRGFYTFSEILQRQRIIIIFIWFSGIFLFSPLLVVLRAVCHESPIASSNITCCINGFCSFTKYNWLQIFLGIKVIIVLIGLIYYLIMICKFKLNRQWPDVWHENLLEESPMIEHCPLIKACELRIDNSPTDESTISITTKTPLPGDQDVMRLQAYLIKYLRHLNGEMARSIFRLNATQKPQLEESIDCSQSRECRFDSTEVTCSSPLLNNNHRC